jgi:hypothetical protein
VKEELVQLVQLSRSGRRVRLPKFAERIARQQQAAGCLRGLKARRREWEQVG